MSACSLQFCSLRAAFINRHLLHCTLLLQVNELLAASDNKAGLVLSESELDLIQETSKILNEFKVQSLQLEAEDHSKIQLVIPNIFHLRDLCSPYPGDTKQ